MPRAPMGQLFTLADPLVLLLDREGTILRSSWSCRAIVPTGEELDGTRLWERILSPADARTVECVLDDAQESHDEAIDRSWVSAGQPCGTHWTALVIPNPTGMVEFVVLTGLQSDPVGAIAPPLSGSPRRLLSVTKLQSWIFDRGTYRFLAVNEAAAERHGYRPEELEAMRILDVRPWEEVSRLVERLTTLAPGVSEQGTWRHREKGGALFDLDAGIATSEVHGRPACVVVAPDTLPGPR